MGILRATADRDLAVYVLAHKAFRLAAAGDLEGACLLAAELGDDMSAQRRSRPRQEPPYASAQRAAGSGMLEQWRTGAAARSWTSTDYGKWYDAIGNMPAAVAGGVARHLGADLARAVHDGDRDFLRASVVRLRDSGLASVRSRSVAGAPARRVAAVLARAAFDAQGGIRLDATALHWALTPRTPRPDATIDTARWWRLHGSGSRGSGAAQQR